MEIKSSLSSLIQGTQKEHKNRMLSWRSLLSITPLFSMGIYATRSNYMSVCAGGRPMASEGPPHGEEIVCVRVPCRDGKERVWRAIELLHQEQRQLQPPIVPRL